MSRHLNRHVSLFFSRFLVRLGWPPNLFTVFFMAIGATSGVLVAFAEHWWALALGGLLFQLQSILDGCDGEIARLTFRFSHAGQWLDSIGDDLTNYAFCIGLAIGQARILDASWLYVLGFLTLFFQLAATGILYRRMILFGTGDLLAVPDMVSGGENDSWWGKVLKGLRLLAKRDTFVFIVATLAALQLPLAAFFTFAAGTYPMFLGVVVNDLRVSRTMKDDEGPGELS